MDSIETIIKHYRMHPARLYLDHVYDKKMIEDNLYSYWKNKPIEELEEFLSGNASDELEYKKFCEELIQKIQPDITPTHPSLFQLSNGLEDCVQK
jgi:hypothetical protein